MTDRDLIDRAVEAACKASGVSDEGITNDEMRAALAAFCREMAKRVPEAIVSPATAAIDDYYDGTKDAPFEGSVKAATGAALETLAALLDPEAKLTGQDTEITDPEAAVLGTIGVLDMLAGQIKTLRRMLEEVQRQN